MTSTIAAPIGAIIAIFWRTVTPGDFFNIERSPETGPKGGGGQRYIDIPLGRGVSLQDFGSFLGRPLSYNDQTWPTVEIQAHTVSSPVIAAPLTLTSRQINRRYRIAQQNRQAQRGQRHPAWTADRGFPRAPDDISNPRDPRMPDLSFLKVYIARTDLDEYHAGYINSATMPAIWPRDIGLEILFEHNSKGEADGIIYIPADAGLLPDHLGERMGYVGGVGASAVHSYPEAHVVLRSTRRAGGRRGRGQPESATPRRDPLEIVSIQAPRASEAEDWVESRLVKMYEQSQVRRIGHTNLETIPLDDGDLPGADVIVFDSSGEQPERFVEVKSGTGTLPDTISLTASEFARAKRCEAEGLPYDIWIVVFDGQSTMAHIMPNFEQSAANITIDDLASLEVHVAPTSEDV